MSIHGCGIELIRFSGFAFFVLQVGTLAYDFTNFVATTECQAQGLLDFKGLDQGTTIEQIGVLVYGPH